MNNGVFTEGQELAILKALIGAMRDGTVERLEYRKVRSNGKTYECAMRSPRSGITFTNTSTLGQHDLGYLFVESVRSALGVNVEPTIGSEESSARKSVTLALSPADADCLVMLLASNEDHECEEHVILAAKWKQMLIDAGARPFPPQQIQVGDLKLWKFSDGDYHYIAARDEAEAMDAYKRDVNDTEDADPMVTPAKVDVDVRLDEPGTPTVKASQLMAEMDGPGVVSSTLF